VRDLVGSAVRFGLVGGLSTLVHVIAFFVFERVFGWGPTPSTTAAFMIAVGVSYVLHRSWTFQAEGLHTRHFPRFAFIALTGLGINVGVMHLTTEVLELSSLLGLAIVVTVVPAVSFLGNRYWGFR